MWCPADEMLWALDATAADSLLLMLLAMMTGLLVGMALSARRNGTVHLLSASVDRPRQRAASSVAANSYKSIGFSCSSRCRHSDDALASITSVSVSFCLSHKNLFLSISAYLPLSVSVSVPLWRCTRLHFVTPPFSHSYIFLSFLCSFATSFRPFSSLVHV